MNRSTPICGLVLMTLMATGMAWVSVPLAQACPMCSETIPSDADDASASDPTAAIGGNPGGGAWAEGFYFSILLMLAVPFLMFAAFGWAFYHHARHASTVSTTATSPGTAPTTVS